LFLFDEKKSVMRLASTTGLAPGYDKGTSYAPGEGITGWVGAHRVPLRLRNCGDPDELSRWDRGLEWKGKTREIASQIGFERPLLAVPILDAQGVCHGVLRASGKVGGTEFWEED